MTIVRAGRAAGVGMLCLVAACVRFGAFECSDAADCNQSPDGACEADGWCSYPDEACPTQRRYGEHAGDGLAEVCVDPAGTGTSTSTSGDSGDPATCDAACSGLGACVLVDDEPTCACEAGTYRVGLECLEDPCVGDAKCFFVDADAGDDTNPGTREQPWRSPAMVEANIPEFGLDTYVLFRRGQQHSGRVVVEGVTASLDSPFTIGAYGPLNEPRPHLDDGLVVRESQGIVVRDLEVESSNDCIMAGQNTDGFVVRGNYVHDCEGNGIRVRSGSAHSVILDNRAENTEDHGINVADRDYEDEYVGSHHYIVDNTLVNAGEIRVMIAQGESDVKIIGNRILGSPGVGVRSQQGTYGWVVGNTVGGAGLEQPADTLPKGTFWVGYPGTQHVSGNVVFDSRVGQRFDEGAASLEHNTFVFVPDDRNISPAVEMASADGPWDLRHNLFVSGATVHLHVSDFADLGALQANAYMPSGAPCSFTIDTDALTFEAWQAMGVDADSTCDVVPGTSSVRAGSSVEAWDAPGFWEALVPAAGWWGCAAAVGAFDCSGARQGLVVEPIDGFGLGWEGQIDVWQRYARGV